MLSIVFLVVTVFLGSFLRKCLPSIQVWINIVCQLSFQVKMVLHEKSQLVQLATQTSRKSLRQLSNFNMQQECFMCTSHFVTQNLKDCTWGLRFHKINIFHCEYIAMKTIVTIRTFCCCCFNSCWFLAFLPTTALDHGYKCQPSEKKQYCQNINMEIFLSLQTP